MIQQGGYGTIIGMQSGAGVGAGMYSNIRSNVVFARMIEQEKLNLETRRLRQAEAEAAANQKMNSRKMNLAERQFDLAARRLRYDHEQKMLREEQLAQDYENRLRMQAEEEQARRQKEAQDAAYKQGMLANDRLRMLLDANNKSQAQGWKEYEALTQAINNGGTVYDDQGNIVQPGGYVRTVTPSGQQIALAVKDNPSVSSQAASLAARNKRITELIDSDLKDMGTGGAEYKRNQAELARLEAEIKAAEAELAANVDGKRQETLAAKVREAQQKYDNRVAELDNSAKQNAIESYRVAAAYDDSLLSDVKYDEWKNLPWSGRDAYTDDQRAIVMNLVGSREEKDRKLLQTIVKFGSGKFNAELAREYMNSDNPVATDNIPPEIWMRSNLDNTQYFNACAVLEGGDAKAVHVLQKVLAENIGIKDWPPKTAEELSAEGSKAAASDAVNRMIARVKASEWKRADGKLYVMSNGSWTEIKEATIPPAAMAVINGMTK